MSDELLKGEINTRIHISDVNALLVDAAKELIDRAKAHDKSKLEEPEHTKFSLAAARFKEPGNEFGSPGYEKVKAELGEALDHHYANNSHHPQHYENGVLGMNLFDVLEMLLDWKAASSRRLADGMMDLSISRTANKVPDDVMTLIRNTAKYLNFEFKE